VGASTRIAVATLVVVVLAGAFWLLALAPQRQQAKELGDEITQLRSSLAESQSQATEALEARRKFPGNYQQLVVLGKAVPNSDETSSLLIQLNQIANRSQVRFDSIKLGASSEETTSETAPATVSPSSPKPIPPTEAAAALLPLGATVGTAGLGVMPYNLTFSGDFFHVADFIKGIDSLVKAKGSHIAVNGRLMTLDGFALSPDSELGFPHLQATFAVTTYLTPPSQGVTAGASSVGPSSEVPAASTTATPEAAPSESTASTATPPAR
jgi:Tfp pilus assembly protein PilO